MALTRELGPLGPLGPVLFEPEVPVRIREAAQAGMPELVRPRVHVREDRHWFLAHDPYCRARYTGHLRFPASEIEVWARRYSYPRSDQQLCSVVRPEAQRQGHITREQLLQICYWKTPRAAGKAEPNDDAFVREVTRIAFGTTQERVRIQILTMLAGVGWPTASAILHYTISEDYPILDVRALWSLEMERTTANYTFPLWDAYIKECRRIASNAGVSVRTLDKALWQYAKTHQPTLSSDD